MGIKILLTGLLFLVLLQGCTLQYNTPYLPAPEKLGESPCGVLIRLDLAGGDMEDGELIAVQHDSIFVLQTSRKIPCGQVVAYFRQDVQTYTIKFVRTPSLGWTIPTFALLTLSHGYFLIFTLPLNIIATSASVAAVTMASTYTEKEVPFSNLSKFSRFPQGIPSGVPISAIRSNLPACSGR